MIAISGASDDESLVLEYIFQHIRRMALADIVHNDVAYALCGQFFCNGLRHLLSISIHAAIGNHHTFRCLITAQTVIDARHLRDILRPHRPMRRAYNLDRQLAQFSHGFLYRIAILAHDVRIITHHLVPILIRIDARVQKAPIQSAETAEAISREQHTVRLIERHHSLRPMHHRSQVKTQFMISQVKEIAFLHLITFTRHAIKSLNHTERLFVAHDNDIGIILLDKTYRTRMIRLHVIDNQILNRAVANNTANLAQEHLEITGIHCIDQRHDVIVYQIGIIRYAIRQWPHPFEEVFVAVIHSYVMDFSFNQGLFIHIFLLCLILRSISAQS